VPATVHVHAAATVHATTMMHATTMSTVPASMPAVAAAMRSEDRRRDEQASGNRRSEGEFSQHWGFLVCIVEVSDKSSLPDEPRLNTQITAPRRPGIRRASRSARGGAVLGARSAGAHKCWSKVTRHDVNGAQCSSLRRFLRLIAVAGMADMHHLVET
jgi:hypothetical protein